MGRAAVAPATNTRWNLERSLIRGAILFLLTLGVAGTVIGGRMTDDAASDVVESLLAAGRLEEAEWSCRHELRHHPEGQLPHARWSARLAMVLAEKNATAIFNGKPSDLIERLDPAIASAGQPVEQLRSRYPEALWDVFLQSAQLAVRQRVLRAAIIVTSVSPPDPETTNALLSKLSRLQLQTGELHQAASRQWSASASDFSGAANESDGLSADQYLRLMQELSLQRVSVALMQCELFPKDSTDYRAAGADAALVAEEAILALADGSDAKRIARGLRAEALLRSGAIAAAGEIIDDVQDQPGAPLSPRWIALRVRLQLAQRNVSAARAICDAFYRSTDPAASAAEGLEMDFAKLELLLADSKNDGAIADWIDQIERRGGAFARRRAESIAIERLRNDTSPSGTDAPRRMSPALIAAQGEDWLRRGDPRQATVLLRAAALAEPSPDDAFEYAAKSAAASIAAKDSPEAIEVLRRVAQKHAAHENAHTLMMQAALLASKPFAGIDDPKVRLALLEDLLKDVSQTWPTRDAAVKANAWLCRILVQSGRQEQAARDALELLTLGKQVDQVEPTMSLWFDYLSSLEPDRATDEIRSLAATLGELAAENDTLAEPIHRVAILLFDRPQMAFDSSALVGADPSTEFLRQLKRFRASGGGGGAAIATKGVENTLLTRARWRLERDAMLDATTQRAIGTELLSWPDANEWQSATAQFWSDRDEASIEAIKRLAFAADPKPPALRRAMQLLAASDSEAAKRSAIELADRLAATMKIGSRDWYGAKSQAIQWLVEIGDQEQATKRARYVLLMHRPGDDELRQRFESLAEN
ncbi:hypothetical protein [Stieleria mannarensis]|uniref:hypothetical protein n=1 Tax=Stieleria mannarensis TaxID=2755585 RepID=UPI0016019A1B|nr:hypothetical protein [Rhodopirellula sp. JC639]